MGWEWAEPSGEDGSCLGGAAGLGFGLGCNLKLGIWFSEGLASAGGLGKGGFFSFTLLMSSILTPPPGGNPPLAIGDLTPLLGDLTPLAEELLMGKLLGLVSFEGLFWTEGFWAGGGPNGGPLPWLNLARISFTEFSD